MPALVSWFMLCLSFDDKESEFVFQSSDKCQNLPDLLASSLQGAAPIFLHHTSSPELLPVVGCKAVLLPIPVHFPLLINLVH